MRVFVMGRVQGVWFRGAMQAEAAGIGATGWVKNLPDGRVEAVVEGTAEAVERMVAWCHHGPAGARVDHVETREEVAEGLCGFDVAY